MSAQELRLRVRIAAISFEIDLQKRLLQKLEHDRSLVLGQLNAVFDPISRLPLEISSEIFLRCHDATAPQNPRSLDPSPNPFPVARVRLVTMLFLNVCNTWTSIALATPALWLAIRIIFPCADGLKQLLPIWFRQIWDDAFDNEYPRETNTIHLFGGTTPGPLPLLETLTIGDSMHSIGFSFLPIFQLLRLAPNLVECTIARCVDSFGEGHPSSEERVLDGLKLPALEVLRIRASDDCLVRFLKRSAPPLRELIVHSMDPNGNPDRLPEYLHFSPSLQRLEMVWPEPYRVVSLFAALADSPSLLPNLRSLTIDNRRRSDGYWEPLLRALAIYGGLNAHLFGRNKLR
ncbi:hypothetical protein DFH08DRAFT_1089967 [Mycena albidolilacea]|uniref:F-box domain-containing protein n=1 Tax=Mycena albidolilacea TaxID=1033008 RepID=A0AAD6YYX6_9AGAR|nr:hypothetical protein DFH08DRAFT_1089967 [Mycena albidolilacea]